MIFQEFENSQIHLQFKTEKIEKLVEELRVSLLRNRKLLEQIEQLKYGLPADADAATKL